MTNFEMVREFHKAFGHAVNTVPTLQDEKVAELRVDLIIEEVAELRMAIEDGDIVEIADALSDLIYVSYGAGHFYGIDLDKCFAEVHKSNMSKLGADGNPIYRDDGKILKGPSYSPPDLKSVLGIGSQNAVNTIHHVSE